MTTTTYLQIESTLTQSLSNVSMTDLPSVHVARAAWRAHRAAHGFTTPGSLTTDETDNEKLAKGKGRRLVALCLAHGDLSGAELCPHRTAGCFGTRGEACVGSSGNGSIPSVVRSRQCRSTFLFENPTAFLALLVNELDAYRRASSGRFGCRLNAFSDIRWERILPAWFWERYRAAAFYDYTKHPAASRPASTVPTNYRLTYSFNERTTERELERQLAVRSVAVVISTRGGTDKRTGAFRPIPDTVLGAKTIDGDIDDRRWRDPAGVVVALRRKGRLSADSPFVVAVPA